MADRNDFNDEYEFTDPDVFSSEPVQSNETFNDGSDVSSPRPLDKQPNVKQKALIIIFAFVGLVILFKFIGYVFSKKPVQQNTAVVTPVKSQPIVESQTPVQSEPLVVNNANVDQKLSVLETTQQNLSANVSSVSSQVGEINSNVSALSNQMTQLNQSIAGLNAKLDSQAQMIDRLIAQMNKPKPIKRTVHYKPGVVIKYYIQAVIPGRAWLIASNGSTLTVREGTVIPGVGTVKLIDPNQGRVLINTGQVIRFSQEDS